MSEHNAVVVTVLCLIIGVKLIGTLSVGSLADLTGCPAGRMWRLIMGRPSQRRGES
jgi:hypothetical protein